MVNKIKLFKSLNEETRAEIKRALGVYTECYLMLTSKGFKVTTGIALTSELQDERLMATYKNKEILTKKERIIAYMENFKDYSMEYEGDRNYQTMDLEFSWLNENE